MKADLGKYFESKRTFFKLGVTGTPDQVCVFSGRKQFPWELRSQVVCSRFCGLEIICQTKFICMLETCLNLSTFSIKVLYYMEPLKEIFFYDGRQGGTLHI